MQRTPVKSTSVRAIGYDPEAQLLEVEFLSGGTYHYRQVSPELHAELMGAQSAGSFLSTRIKGRFSFQRQEPKDFG